MEKHGKQSQPVQNFWRVSLATLADNVIRWKGVFRAVPLQPRAADCITIDITDSTVAVTDAITPVPVLH